MTIYHHKKHESFTLKLEIFVGVSISPKENVSIQQLISYINYKALGKY